MLNDQAVKLCPSCSSKCYSCVWRLSKYTCLKASAAGGKWGEIPGCPCVRKKERESWGERKHSRTFTTVLQISLPGPVAEVWFYCGPHRRGDRGDNLISPAWALSCKLSDSCHKLHLCPVCACLCLCVCLGYLWNGQRVSAVPHPQGQRENLNQQMGLSSCCFIWRIIIFVVNECECLHSCIFSSTGWWSLSLR